MQRYLACGRFLGGLALLIVLALCAFGTAQAATPPAGSVGQSNPHTSFDGFLAGSNFLPECTSQAEDPGNLACEHFTLTVESPGSVATCVSFGVDPLGLNDIDVFVYDQAGNQVAAGTSGEDNPECATFATAAPATLEIRVKPAFLMSPTNIHGEVDFTANGGGAGMDGGITPPANCAPPPSSREVHGNGEVLPATMSRENGKFETELHREVKSNPNDSRLKAKARYSEDKMVAFKSTMTCVVFDDANEAATIFGHGVNKLPVEHQVDFMIRVDDNGDHPDTNDAYEIHLSDGFNNVRTLVKGEIEYRVH